MRRLPVFPNAKGGATKGQALRNKNITRPSLVPTAIEARDRIPAGFANNASAASIPYLPDGRWHPPETLPRDGKWIVVKRRHKPNMGSSEMETRWTVSKVNRVGYWATRSARVREEDILGWRPK